MVKMSQKPDEAKKSMFSNNSNVLPKGDKKNTVSVEYIFPKHLKSVGGKSLTENTNRSISQFNERTKERSDAESWTERYKTKVVHDRVDRKVGVQI